jgi:hypothetical protein
LSIEDLRFSNQTQSESDIETLTVPWEYWMVWVKQTRCLSLNFGFEVVYYHVREISSHSRRDMAQLVVRLVRDQEVAGSSPAVPTT